MLKKMSVCIGLSVLALLVGSTAAAQAANPKLVEQKVSHYDKDCSKANYDVHFTVQAQGKGSFKYKFVASDGSETEEHTWNASKANDRHVTSHSFKPANVKHGDKIWFGIQFEGDAAPQHIETVTAQCKD